MVYGWVVRWWSGQVRPGQARGLVAEAQAQVWVAAHFKTPPLGNLTVLVNDEHGSPYRATRAAGEDAEVIRGPRDLRQT
jgi:hypothetical protein